MPLLRTDPYGNFIPNAAGFAQVITGVGADGIPNTADDIVISGTSTAPVSVATAIRINAAFLADIAHDAVPNGIADGDIEHRAAQPRQQPGGLHDNELLDAHFIAGDGRANENIGLTAVHHIFHSSTTGWSSTPKRSSWPRTTWPSSTNGWPSTSPHLPTTPAQIAALVWDGERLFRPPSSAPRCNTNISSSRTSPARCSPTSTSSSCRTDTTPTSIRALSPNSRTWSTASATQC